MNVTTIENGRLVTPEGIYDGGRIVFRNGRIDRIDPDPGNDTFRGIDAEGSVVMPGLIDLHGDDVEQQLFPRANARVDARLAITMADRMNLAAGITTKFHAIAFEEAPTENRTTELATEIATAITRTEGLCIDNRVHARCELAPESVAAVSTLLDRGRADLVSLMHHTPGNGQFASDEAFIDAYVADRDFTEQEATDLLSGRKKIDEESLSRRSEYIAALACKYGIPVASHDDADPDRIDRMARLGVTISEYPVTIEAARRADERGLITAMGAPNLSRGGSLRSNLSALEAIDRGVLDVLCSDYYPPSLLTAAFVETGESLVERIDRVTRNPADAVGLSDRGRLLEGARADVLIVDPEPIPTVRRAFVGGVETFRAEPSARNGDFDCTRRGLDIETKLDQKRRNGAAGE